MPFLRRRFSPEPDDRVLLASTSYLSRTLRASAITVRGLVWDAASLPEPREDSRVYVHVVLSGALRTAGELLGPGDLVVAPSYAALHRERPIATGEPHRALAIRLDGVAEPRRARGSIVLASQAFDAVASESPWARSSVARFVASLDLPKVPERDADIQEDPMATALSRVLSEARGLPSLVDLGLELSSRQARRRLHGFFRANRMPFQTFREMRLSFTLTAAMLYLARPDVSLERAAHAVGMSSATSLCHALAKAHLPAPRIARERIAGYFTRP